jgi:predicted MPP superfamily phosphohydrolase
MVDRNNKDIKPVLDLIKGLSDKPVFFVSGNHDWWINNKIREHLISAGANILENSSYKYSKNGDNIWIIGVDDPYLGMDDLSKAIENTDDSIPRLLLAHAPDIFNEAIQSEIDLVLVGHTHGGQVRLPVIGAIVAPGQGLFPKLDYGLYSSNTTTMVINGGLGESVLPIRFYNRPEVVFITLKRMQQ